MGDRMIETEDYPWNIFYPGENINFEVYNTVAKKLMIGYDWRINDIDLSIQAFKISYEESARLSVKFYSLQHLWCW